VKPGRASTFSRTPHLAVEHTDLLGLLREGLVGAGQEESRGVCMHARMYGVACTHGRTARAPACTHSRMHARTRMHAHTSTITARPGKERAHAPAPGS